MGAPLMVAGILLLRSEPGGPPGDPWWFALSRWVLQGGVVLMVHASRSDVDSALPMVYSGLAVVVLALLAVIPRRLSVPMHTVGLLLIVIGALGAIITVAVAATGAGRISGPEMALGRAAGGRDGVSGLGRNPNSLAPNSASRAAPPIG